MIFEFASSMAARGHEVHLYHVPFYQANVTGLDDIDWFQFDDRVVHHFFADAPIDPTEIPAADVIFGYSTEEDLPPQTRLPVVLIQGYRMLGAVREHPAFRAPCPKLCVASWLVEIGKGLGVPERQLVHIPLGLRHEKYILSRPIASRPPTVSFCYSAHAQKGASLAIKVLDQVRRVVPEMNVVAFGAVPAEHDLPQWIDYRINPSQHELVHGIYNRSRIFLCTSEVEGFGLTNIEAMAGGAALVTTDNGGSRDYAFHEETALVAPPRDAALLAGYVERLLTDEERRLRIAQAGSRYVLRFDWERSAELLESFLESYAADPVAYGRPPGSGRLATNPR
jgi:glycosyltransferase involved in cell wall biosynthesis